MRRWPIGSVGKAFSISCTTWGYAGFTEKSPRKLRGRHVHVLENVADFAFIGTGGIIAVVNTFATGAQVLRRSVKNHIMRASQRKQAEQNADHNDSRG